VAFLHRSSLLVSTAGSLFLLLVGAALGPAYCQQSVQIIDVNPNQSSLGPREPDGASSGRINGLAASPGQPSVVYAASEWGGLFKSSDGGMTWQHLDGHLPSATWAIAVDPSNSERVFATSFYDGRVDSLSGINVSPDAGVNWTHPSALPPAAFCSEDARREEPSAFGIGIDPDDSKKVYVGTNCGLAVSDDSGATWHYSNPSAPAGADDIWGVVAQHGGIVDVCGDVGHARTTDGGHNWKVSDNLPSGMCSIAASPTEAYVLFAVVGTSPFESDDGGRTWQPLTNPNGQGRIPFFATNRRSGPLFDLWFGDVSLYRTGCKAAVPAKEGGTARCPRNSWSAPYTRKAGAHDDVAGIIFSQGSPNNACPRWYASDGGVYLNTVTAPSTCQAPVWRQPDITPHALWLFSMDGTYDSANGESNLYLASQDNGTYWIGSASSASPSWANVDCCDSFGIVATHERVAYTTCCWDPAPATRIYVRGPHMDKGGEIHGEPPGDLPGWVPGDVIVNLGGSKYAVVTNQGVYETEDIAAASVQWRGLASATLPRTPCGIKVSTSSSGSTSLYLRTAKSFKGNRTDCSAIDEFRIFRLVGTGDSSSWMEVLPPGSGGFGVFAVDPKNPNRLFAALLQGAPAQPRMVSSEDGGVSWQYHSDLDDLMTSHGLYRYRNRRGPTDFTSFYGYVQPTLVSFDPNDGNHLAAGSADAGIFESNDGGATWKILSASSGPPQRLPRPRFAFFVHSTGEVDTFIGTQGRGVWLIRAVSR
jgi:hypothetical protein